MSMRVDLMVLCPTPLRNTVGRPCQYPVLESAPVWHTRSSLSKALIERPLPTRLFVPQPLT